jgi:hypothetical protein
MLVYLYIFLYILWPSGIFCGHLVYFMIIKYTFFLFGVLYQEKSGNPDLGYWKVLPTYVGT